MYRFNRYSTMWISVLTVFGLFAVLQASEVVDLSNRGLKKEIFFVKTQHTINLNNVTDLILRGNDFDSFLDCSTQLTNLRKLDLSENHLQKFFFLCKEEYNLEVLNISHNELGYIDELALNDRIYKLKVLDISWNRVTVLNETMLQETKNLEFLSMASNPLIEIHEKSFWPVRNLVHLDLSNVSASSFPSALFKPLTNLTFLNISCNPIEIIPILPISLQELDISRTNILYSNIPLLPNLVSLHMNYLPKLTDLYLNDFENMTMLDTLSMEGCRQLTQLRVWPPNGKLLPRLQRLSIRSCGIESLNDDLRPIIQRTPVVDLGNNPWHCDCRMQWVNRLSLTHQFRSEIRCLSPPQHEGKLLSDIPSIELTCENESGVVYPLIWAAVAVLTLAMIAIAVFLISKKTPISQWKLPKRGGNTVSYKNVVESNNDLIRILTPGETSDRPEE